MTTVWSGASLVAEGQLTTSGGATTAVKECCREAKTHSSFRSAGDKTSRLRYVRLTDTGACESWPNPCKKAPGL